MTDTASRSAPADGDWHLAMPLDKLRAQGGEMLRIADRQIAFFYTEGEIRACDNRCPHEGYPLSEGSLSKCILTCNWHNWKFDLDSGDNLYGGDRLRVYPTEIRGEEVWVDISEPPFAERYASITQSLHDAFDDYSYDRIAREIARLSRLGADPLDALRLAIDWSWRKMEFGWTHAYAGMSDWLTLYDEQADDPELQLVCLVESVSHVAYDVLRERDYPYFEGTASFDEENFIEAVENEDEALAIGQIRGALADGLGYADLESALTRAALLHYNDFGHSLIYVTKVGRVIERLGESVALPLLLSLVREMIFASREDRIPEFRAYAAELARWGRADGTRPDAELWRKRGINKSMRLAVACSDSPVEDIYHALLLANANNLLNFDISQQDKIRVSVSGNVNWLDFTHGLTFANAVRLQCSRYPELWPQGLLQMACFNGRNAAFTVAESKFAQPRNEIPDGLMAALLERVLDHGQAEHIVSVHLLKTALAVREEIAILEAVDANILLAAVSRFFDSPLKRRQARRTAYQSLQFVSRE